MKTTINSIILAILLITGGTAHAQFLKKLKKKVTQAVENTIVNTADEAVNDVIGNKENNTSERENPASLSITENKTITNRQHQKPTSRTTEGIVKSTDKFSAVSTMTIPTIDEDFESISLLTFKGLPLLGEPDKNLIGLTVGKEYEKYNGLLKVKFYRPLFDTMDKEVWYPNRYAGEIRYPREGVNSVIAQKALFAAATSLSSRTACEIYYDRPGEHKSYRNDNKTWGGYNASDIRQNTLYKKYIAEQLGNLQRYAEKIPTTAYVVDKMGLMRYDFDQNGFILEIPVATPNVIYTKRSFGGYAPRHEYEQVFKTKRRRSFDYLFKIKPEKVEQLFEGKTRSGRSAYFVHKIEWYGADHTPTYKEYVKYPQLKTVRKAINYHRLQYSYADPLIEIYLDPELTQKIGEIDLAKIDTKQLKNENENETEQKPTLRKEPHVNFENAIPLSVVHEKPEIPFCTDSKDRRCQEKYINEWLQDKITNDKLKEWFKPYNNSNHRKVSIGMVLDTNGKFHIKNMRPFNEKASNGIQKILNAHTLNMKPARQRGKPVHVMFVHNALISYNIRKY
ncbi:hypothetical protein [Marixanthomonas spongiae]|uniref:TonB C-terminal domain-containing protein n=1 Tax=Marixanthomonas spongiae TaxID=2174845 RepID=A0A2U0HVH3_9FLAO|nr:hypothetical protein [Marixanthomonas spongiae]PVW12847.1 hypothetical protein DDV96_14580 [Marixanthomonas spongiae]